MVKRVTMDAMIPRADFAYQGDEFVLDLFPGFPISNLGKDQPILKLLRKPDFQRETNHWNGEQVATFIASFLDNEVIPSLILWKSPSFIFVIDGGHRLSALRAWMEDDYGDKAISKDFYADEISEEQLRVAKHARTLIEDRIGRFTELRDLVGKRGTEQKVRRANLLFTRALPVQWVQGDASVAETSFFKINSQGTPLDETEELLIRNRRKPIPIGARAVLRAGAGHKYWSAFPDIEAKRIEQLASEFHQKLFQPEADQPLKTLELPLGGSVSPVDALSLLIDFLTIAGSRAEPPLSVSEYPDDTTGDATITILNNSLHIIERITGNTSGSLGLHPAVYFYNERGKYSRFLFLGVTLLITDRVRNNDSAFFKRFTLARAELERFLIDNKSLIGILLQNMNRKQRVPKVRDLLAFLVQQFSAGKSVTVENAIEHLGLRGRIIDVVSGQAPVSFSDDVKSSAFIRKALDAAIKCEICGGKLDATKSISYDHKTPVRDGGRGHVENADLVHPYCNSARDGLEKSKNRK